MVGSSSTPMVAITSISISVDSEVFPQHGNQQDQAKKPVVTRLTRSLGAGRPLTCRRARSESHDC